MRNSLLINLSSFSRSSSNPFFAQAQVHLQLSYHRDSDGHICSCQQIETGCKASLQHLEKPVQKYQKALKRVAEIKDNMPGMKERIDEVLSQLNSPSSTTTHKLDLIDYLQYLAGLNGYSVYFRSFMLFSRLQSL